METKKPDKVIRADYGEYTTYGRLLPTNVYYKSEDKNKKTKKKEEK